MNITALDGMQAAQAQVEQAAAQIASFPSSVNDGDSVDLSTEMVALVEAGNNFAANVTAQEVMDETTQSTLNLVG